MDGLTRIEVVNDELALKLPEGEYETVAGLILERLGRLPQVGEQVHLDGVSLTVLDMQGPRIARVKLIRR